MQASESLNDNLLIRFQKPKFYESDDANSDINDAFSRLSLYEPSSQTSSSSSENETYEQSTDQRCKQLNEFLRVSGCEEPKISLPRSRWQNMSSRSKSRRVDKATTAIVAALKVIAPNDAGSLWEAVQSSHKVDKALGSTSSVEQMYLKAFAETYENAESWQSQRQILSIFADLVPNTTIEQYIPGINEYRVKIARLHIADHGRGASIPVKKSARLRIDESQLDHFLSFITSPHVIQDLPFGQKYLRLSDGRVLETPNVIRSMIPQRIVEQYTQFCKESDVKPLSPSTIRRILTVCSASVRKSLQGLDYISADGAKAFDDLIELIRNAEHLIDDKEDVKLCEEALKTSKQYIKTDYKVCNS